jgi:hypothetical protein
MNLRLPFATTGSPKPKYREVFEFNGAVCSPGDTLLSGFMTIWSAVPALGEAISQFNRENTGNSRLKG